MLGVLFHDIQLKKDIYLSVRNLLVAIQKRPFPRDHIAIGLLQLGRVKRTVYPQLTTKRIGRSGESKYHDWGLYGIRL